MIDEIINFCLRHSDMSWNGLSFLAQQFVLAHQRTGAGLSIEIGTRRGGSALLMLSILQSVYPKGFEPVLFTVDPYGLKPYKGGDVSGRCLYGDPDYLAMKALLSGYSNHVHWYMESLDFLRIASSLSYWRNGGKHWCDGVSFALLDGDHDSETVLLEIELLMPRMHSSGIILIDNVDKDPLLLPGLSKWEPWLVKGLASDPGAAQAAIHLDITGGLS